MRIVSTIEARMTSSRLPGKVLLPAADRPMLFHLIRRLRAVPSIAEIVLATTTNATDDVLVDVARAERIRVFRGSEDDVMTRVIEAAESARADVVVEITGDCPIIDPEIAELVIRMYVANSAAYVSNNHLRTYPDGMDTQVFALETLKLSASMTDDRLDHEHVTLHIRNHPELFPPIYVVAPPDLHWPRLGLTLDEPADYELIRRLIEHFEPANPLFGCEDVIRLLKSRPEWVDINRSVARKGDT